MTSSQIQRHARFLCCLLDWSSPHATIILREVPALRRLRLVPGKTGGEIMDSQSIHINLDAHQVGILSDLANRQHTAIENIVESLLVEALENHQENKRFHQLINERDTLDAKFVPYDTKIWL